MGRKKKRTCYAPTAATTYRTRAIRPENQLEAYLGYQNALLELQQMTFYDFERGMPLMERFRIGALAEQR